MKTPSTDLFDLIKTLTPQEKKYFKQYSARYGTNYESIYIELFDVIAQQTQYNESAIKKHFVKKNISKQLPVYKNYLLDNILNCLVSMDQQTNKHLQLLSKIQQYKILYDKQLYRPMQKMRIAIQQMATEQGCEGYLLELLKLEPTLIKILDDEDRTNRLEQLNKEVEEEIKKIENYWNYLHLREQAVLISNTGIITPENTEKMESIQQNKLMKSPSCVIHKDALFYFYEIHIFCDYYLNTLDNSYHVLRHFLIEQLSQQQQGVYNENNYFFACSRFLQICLAQNYFAEIKPIINLLKKIKINNNRLYFLSQNCIFQYTLLDFILAGYSNEQIPQNWWQENKNWWVTYQHKLSTTSRNLHQLNLIRLFFLLKDWRNTIYFIEDLISKNIHYSYNSDSQVRLLWLMMQYEMGNVDLLDTFSNSVKSWLVKHNKLNARDKMIVKFFHKIPNIVGKKLLINHFIVLKQNLLALNNSNREELSFFFWAWIDSKIEQVSIKTVLQRNTVLAPLPLHSND